MKNDENVMKAIMNVRVLQKINENPLNCAFIKNVKSDETKFPFLA